MLRFIVFSILLLVPFGCRTPEPVEVTRVVTEVVTETVVETVEVAREVTEAVEVTRVVTETPEPTEVPQTTWPLKRVAVAYDSLTGIPMGIFEAGTPMAGPTGCSRIDEQLNFHRWIIFGEYAISEHAIDADPCNSIPIGLPETNFVPHGAWERMVDASSLDVYVMGYGTYPKHWQNHVPGFNTGVRFYIESVGNVTSQRMELTLRNEQFGSREMIYDLPEGYFPDDEALDLFILAETFLETE